MQAILNYLRTLNQFSNQMTMVIHDTSVVMTEADGRTRTLPTDNKKMDSRAENGLVKLHTKTHWNGQTLISEIEVDDGPTIERKYELLPDGTELRVGTRISGTNGRGGGQASTFVYERPAQ